MKYNSKGCHRLKELQKCLVSSAGPEYPGDTWQLLGARWVHRGRAVSLDVSLCPDARLFLGSPGAHWMDTAEMRTRVTTVTTGFGVKQRRRRTERSSEGEVPSLTHFCLDMGSFLVL